MPEELAPRSLSKHALVTLALARKEASHLPVEEAGPGPVTPLGGCERLGINDPPVGIAQLEASAHLGLGGTKVSFSCPDTTGSVDDKDRVLSWLRSIMCIRDGRPAWV
jgi:hypothetical protein